jgi:tetratricopeptide (TPR) repeat protein
MHTDQWGQEVTATSAEAVEALDTTVVAYLGLRLDTGNHLKSAFKADPEMPMASIARGNFMQLFCHAGLLGKADESIAGAEAAIAKHGATRREEIHLQALKSWRAGDLRATLDGWEQVLLENPNDVLALRLAHFLHFYLGDMQCMRDSVNRVMYAWDSSVPAYGFVKGMQSFGFEETGNYAAAEAAGREAVEINPQDTWSTHSVAHVMEMMGRHEDGIEWLEGLCGNWGGVNNFKYHTWWHLALYYLEREDFTKVLELYDTEFRKELTDDHIDIANATSMLLRLEMRGVDIGNRWDELGEVCAKHIDDHLFAFHDAHYMMAIAGAGRANDVDAMLRTMAEAAKRDDTTEAAVYRDVGLPLSQAIVASRNKEYGKVVDLLAPVRYQVYRIGGSHAQRDVFAQLLVHAAIADGRHDLARALLGERVERRPGSSLNWRWLGETLDGLGETNGAVEARGKAEKLIAA